MFMLKSYIKEHFQYYHILIKKNIVIKMWEINVDIN